MKKKYFTYAGIIAALVLAGMFIGICLSAIPFPFLPPGTSIDPVTDQSVDENNIMTLTGMTSLPAEDSQFFITVTTSPPLFSQGNSTAATGGRGSASVVTAASGVNRWKGTVDISRFPPADYTITLTSVTFDRNFTLHESPPIATRQFTLLPEDAGPGVRKKTRVIAPFIRVNPAREPGGESREISGITSLAPDTPLEWSLSTETNGTGTTTRLAGGTTRVTTGTEGINRWSALPGTGVLQPARYRFTITGSPIGNTSPAAAVSASSEFDVRPDSAPLKNTTGTGQVPREFIAIDSLPAIRTNNIFTITGTTSLPAGSHLTVEVYPASFETGFNFSIGARDTGENRSLSSGAVFSGVTGGIDVVPGTDRNNLWSFRLETYLMSPGQYAVNVSNGGSHDTANASRYGSLSSARIFPVSGDAL